LRADRPDGQDGPVKALVLTASGVLVHRDVPDPEPAGDEVVVEVAVCGICGSDVHGFDGTTGRRRPPLIMGHEAAGTIAALGADVTAWNVGDRVTFGSTVFCGACSACGRGEVNLCARRSVLGAATAEFRRDGAFAERVAVPARLLIPVPDALAFETAAFAEPLAIAVHAGSLAPAKLGGSVVVIGTGVIGLLMLQVARAAGFQDIIGIDLDDRRLDLARSLGASATLRADDPAVRDAVLDMTGGRGADVVFEAVGIQASITTAIGCARRGGTVVLIGNLSPRVEIPLQDVVTGQITLVGSCASANEEVRSLELLASGAVDVEPLLSAVAPLSEGAAWFDRLHRGEPDLVKVQLRP
jgi:L-iditol 2-dehydrogenase